MRPQQNFYYYDASTNQCLNFPYTGACQIPNIDIDYGNIFPSYDECMQSVRQNQDYYQGFIDYGKSEDIFNEYGKSLQIFQLEIITWNSSIIIGTPDIHL